MTRSPNGAGPPDSLSVPQDTKSNPSNGLVERVARIIDETFGWESDCPCDSCVEIQEARASEVRDKADQIHALYQQEGVLSSQRGEDWADWLERAALICEAEARVFLSPEYAHDQPLSSFSERFACATCARAIRAAKPLLAAPPASQRGENRPANASPSAALHGANLDAEPSAAERMAQRFHETYERLAPAYGYETREASAKPWADVPLQNKRLMVAVCDALRAWVISETTPWQPIETAPRDGTLIDLWVHWPEHDEQSRATDAHWNAAEEEWQLSQYHTGQFMYRPAVTHWMPLPASPATHIGGLSLGVEGDQGVSVAGFPAHVAEATATDAQHSAGEEE